MIQEARPVSATAPAEEPIQEFGNADRVLGVVIDGDAPTPGLAPLLGNIEIGADEVRLALLEFELADARQAEATLRYTLAAREASMAVLLAAPRPRGKGARRWWRGDLPASARPQDGTLAQAIVQSGLFVEAWYSKHYAAQIERTDPLTHFVETGIATGLAPNPFFDPEWYLKTHEEVAAARVPAIMHYLGKGALNAFAPGPLFNPIDYMIRYDDLAEEPDLLGHYLTVGIYEGRVISPVRVGSAATPSA